MGDTNKKTKKILSILLVVFIVFALGFLTWSSRGTIKKFFGFATVYDSFGEVAAGEGWVTNSGSYAWGESIGWVDFSSKVNNKVVVADNALWGYAYGENVGWISLNCGNTSSCGSSDFKVINDGAGNLSGFAYGENIGWINFAPSASTSVVINSSGDFTGYAWGENVGWISFNSANGGSESYKVSTTWRHQVDRPECNDGLDNDNDGSIDMEDLNCPSKDTDSEVTAPKKKETKIGLISISKPTADMQWEVNNDYNINWAPISTTTDSFVYLIGGGYEDDYKKLVAIASSTEYALGYHVTEEDLPKVLGAKWNVVVCVGEMTADRKNCGFSGPVYIKKDNATELNYLSPVSSSTSGPKGESDSGNSGSGSSGSTQEENLPPIQTVEIPVIKLEPLAPLVELPKFGTTSSSFTFIPPISSFVFAPLPESLSAALNKAPKLKDYLASVGFSKEQDLVSLNFRPISLQPIPSPLPPGLFVVSRGENTLRTSLVADKDYYVAQMVRVTSGTPITISLIPVGTGDVVGDWAGQKISFVKKDGKATLEFNSETPGKYILTTVSSPLPLSIEVIEQPKTVTPGDKPAQSGGWFSRLFGR